MTRRLAASATMLLLLAILSPASPAAETQGDWEFHFFVGKASLDNSDPFALTASGSADFDSDGTVTNGMLQRSLSFNDDLYAGFRLGYVWRPFFETEVSYDRNHTGSDFQQTIEDIGPGGTTVQSVDGTVSTIFTSYQVGGLFFPLAFWRTEWQPFVALSMGVMDVDFIPSASIESEVKGGYAVNTFGAEFPTGDQSFMIGYGVGIKYHINEMIALRSDFRFKTYDLLDDRRTDRELTFGFSFFAPGNY